MLFARALFNAADGTGLGSYVPEIGTLVKHPAYSNGEPSITGNRLGATMVAAPQAWFFSDTPPDASYRVKARVYIATPVGQLAIHTRFSPAEFTAYSVQWHIGTWTLYRWVNGNPEALATYAQALSGGESFDVVFQAVTVGSAVYLFATIDGVPAIAYADTDVARITATGKAGFNWYLQEASAGFQVDSFEAGTDGDTYAVDDERVYLSDLNWKLSGSDYAQSNTPGAYLKAKFTGTRLSLEVDQLPLLLASVSASNYPKVIAVVDGERQPFVQLTSTSTLIEVASGLGEGVHEATVYFAGVYWNSSDRWTTPSMVLRVSGVVIDADATLSAPSVKSRKLLVYADSNGEGWEAIAPGITVANMDASRAFPILLGQHLNAEVSVVAFAGQGYTASVGTANVPDLVDAWDFYWNGNSRLSGGEFVLPPDVILSMHGINDGGDVTADAQALIAAWRVVAADAKIAICVPPSDGHQSELAAAVAGAADGNAKLVDINEDVLATPEYANNTVHLSLAGQVYYAQQLYGQLLVQFPELAPVSGGIVGYTGGRLGPFQTSPFLY